MAMTGRRLLRDWRVWAAILLALVIIAAHASGLSGQLCFRTLQNHRAFLTSFVENHFFGAGGLYVLLYASMVALSAPGAVFLTITGGFLFGALHGALFSLIGASAGAIAVFLLARTIFGDDALAKLGPRAVAFAANIRKHAWPYLLAMRLVPLFPFFIVNVIPAFAHVKAGTYIWTTVLGILPGTVVFSLAGASLGRVLDQGDAISVRSLLTPELLGTFAGLACLSILAVIIRRSFMADDRT